MAENNYSNQDIMNLFIIFGQCDKIISRTCRKFNETYRNLPRMNPKKLRRLQHNFRNHGSKLKAPLNLPRPVTSDEGNEINVLAYFNIKPRLSIRRFLGPTRYFKLRNLKFLTMNLRTSK